MDPSLRWDDDRNVSSPWDGIDQPKVSAILRGKISGFSTDRLLRYLALLGHSVCISISQEQQDRGSIRIHGP